LSASTAVPGPAIQRVGSKRGIIAYGSSDPAVKEARDLLESRHDIRTDYLRIRALPFTQDVEAFLREKEVVYVVEQNRDAQMASLLRDFFPDQAAKLRSVLHYDSTAITAQAIVDPIVASGK
jgi:2-oxoglutarate ferredoxin oxidoreductase subunit alpha